MPPLQNTYVSDEKLFEKLNGAVSNEMERGGGDTNHPQKPTKPSLLTEVQEMKAEFAAIRESMGNRLRTTTADQYRFRNEEMARPRRCANCLREAFGDRCTHCYICRKSGHFSYNCQRPQA